MRTEAEKQPWSRERTVLFTYHDPYREIETRSFLEAITDENWGEKLAVLAQGYLRLTPAEITGLQKLHATHVDMPTVAFGAFGSKRVLGLVTLVAAFLATQVPKDLFERMGWDYVEYRTWLFVALLVAVGFVAYYWFELGGEMAIASRNDRVLTAVLTLLASRLPERDLPQSSSV